MKNWRRSAFLALVVLLLAIHAVLLITSIREEAQTWDEGIHLAAGYSYWKTRGDFRMNPEHPPLSKLLCALPLLFMNVGMPTDESAWQSSDETNFGALFLYTNRIPAGGLLFPARLVTIALTLILGLSLALWTRARFGSATALTALTLFTFDPNITAHGRYVTSDMAVTLFSFLACISWSHPVLAGLATGLALGSKASAIYLVPVFLILAVLTRPAVRSLAIMTTTALATLLFICAGHPAVYIEGARQILEHSRSGHVSYLLGSISQTGWWYYFPVAFAVKWPVAVLALLAIALFFALRRRRMATTNEAVLLIPVAVFGGLCLVSRIDIGIRHLLPLIPPLYILTSVALVRKAPRWLIAAGLVLLIAESLLVFPHYLAFFNVLAGGPSEGPRYLLDSNIDWGQDTKKLKDWLDRHGTNRVCRVYFGQAILAHYGIEEAPLPGIEQTDEIRKLDCYVAASVTPLYGLYVPNDRYRWLRAFNPIAKIGYSIYVYDFRKPREPLLPAGTASDDPIIKPF